MIYLDYQATTPLAPEASAAMRPWLEDRFANPHSSHRLGREAAAAVEVARERVVEVLSRPLPDFREGAGGGLFLSSTPPDDQEATPGPSRKSGRGGDLRTPSRATEALRLPLPDFREGVGGGPSSSPAASHDQEPTPDPSRQSGRGGRGGKGGKLFFTSGATEAANWALKGAAARLPPNRRRIVTLATEHACVLDTIRWLGNQGFDIDILPVQPDGLVDLTFAAERIDSRTGLVAAMLVNNEIGTIQPVAALGALAHAAGALFFCDAVQGLGRVPLPLDACDLVAVSAHKVHGPKGIGALWVRDGIPLDPLLHGGGQEGGLRSGTLSPALCAGFGEAARLLIERAEADRGHAERLFTLTRQAMPLWTLNGSADARYKGNLSLRRDGVDAARLISELRQVAFSAGSACASGSGRPSHVLAALGLTEREARSTIRLGFGRYTSEEELLEALALIDAAAARQLSFAA